MLSLGLLAFLGLLPPATEAPLTKVAEVPLPGTVKRFDYQSIDESTGRLFLSHMGDGHIVVVDLAHETVLADLDGFSNVTGTLAVPREGKLYASAAGTNEVVVVDLRSLKTLARLKGARFPDGIAYAPRDRRVFVSDESGGIDLVIDATTDKVIRKIELGGEAGNTHYAAVRNKIFVAVQTKDEMVEIDPRTLQAVHFPLPGSDSPHGFCIDEKHGLAYVSCQGNARLLVLDLATRMVLQSLPVGSDPDVLAFDAGLDRLYVACESGVVNVFQFSGGKLIDVGEFRAPHAHSVAVDQKTHKVYLPLKDVGGKPVLWVLSPASA